MCQCPRAKAARVAGPTLRSLVMRYRTSTVGLNGHHVAGLAGEDGLRGGHDQVRGLPVLVLGAADGLAVDGDYQPAAGLHGPGPEAGAGRRDPDGQQPRQRNAAGRVLLGSGTRARRSKRYSAADSWDRQR